MSYRDYVELVEQYDRENNARQGVKSSIHEGNVVKNDGSSSSSHTTSQALTEKTEDISELDTITLEGLGLTLVRIDWKRVPQSVVVKYSNGDKDAFAPTSSMYLIMDTSQATPDIIYTEHTGKQYKVSTGVKIAMTAEEDGAIQIANSVELTAAVKAKALSVLGRYELSKLRTFHHLVKTDASFAKWRGVLDSLFVYVIDELENSIQITNIEYTSSVDYGYMGGMYFEVDKPSIKGGIEIKYENGGIAKIERASTLRSYGVVFSPGCKTTCTIEVRPFAQDSAGKKGYGSWQTVSYATKGTSVVRPNWDASENDLVKYVYNGGSRVASDGVHVAGVPFIVAGWGVMEWLAAGATAYVGAHVLSDVMVGLSEYATEVANVVSEELSYEIQNVREEVASFVAEGVVCSTDASVNKGICAIEGGINALFIVIPSGCAGQGSIQDQQKNATQYNNPGNVKKSVGKSE